MVVETDEKVEPTGRLQVPSFLKQKLKTLTLRASANDKATHGSSIRDRVVRDVHADMAAKGSLC